MNKYELEEIHTDFEISIGEACRMVYPEVNIKYCIWHIKRALILKKKEICKEEVAACDNCYILYNMLCNLYLCPIEYVVIFFCKIKNNSDNERFDEFIKYYEDYYINLYNYKRWNFFDNPRNITKNSCEAYDRKINGIFKVKPTFFKLVFELRLEENDIVNTYSKRKAGLLGKESHRTIKVKIY